MPQTGARPFPTKLHKGESPEAFIAGGRVVLASAVLIAVWIAAQSTGRFAALTHALAASYWALSLVVLFAPVSGSAKWLIFVADTVDLIFPTCMALFTGGTKSPFYVLYLWVIFAASVRWGIKRAVVTAGICTGVVVASLSLLSVGDFRTLVQGEYDPSALVPTSAYYLMVLAAILYLAEKQKRIRSAALLVNRLMANARIDVGMTRSLQTILADVVDTFGAQEAIVVCRDHQSSQTMLLRVAGSEQKAAWQEVRPEEAAQFFELSAWSSAEPGLKTQPRVAYMKRSQVRSWHSMFGDAGTQLLLAHISEFPDWDIELILLGPRDRGHSAQWLLERIVVDVVPTIHNVYLVRRLRSRARALERSRLAHELHDGTLQSLFAMRLQLKALHRRHVLAPQIGSDIDRVEHLLRAEMIQLRGLMQRMSDPTVEPGDLVKTLAEFVGKFERDSDLHTTFTCDSPVINLPSETCRELLRITQEALVNVHKHSGAHNVMVEFRAMHGIYLLGIEDDGVGFDFKGRFTAAELNRMQKGPRMIKQRAESIGAKLMISSNPGRGSRLEIVLIPAELSAEAHA
jgi:signal transduction histidine kinase